MDMCMGMSTRTRCQLRSGKIGEAFGTCNGHSCTAFGLPVRVDAEISVK